MIEHSHYQIDSVAIKAFQQELPVFAFKEQIIQAVDANQVTLITAETGAGKSTQIPQYLLASGYRKVIVTQPRILAARNLAQRVREEWLSQNEAPESLVAYRTAHERDDDEHTSILYCTDGLQLVREVTGAGTLDGQVLILDEVHEWNQNMEVLVAWAKRRCLEEPQFKVVVMSATIDAAALASYFNAGRPIEIPGRSFPIAKRTAETLVEEVRTQIERGGRNVLVFLPGKSEIERVAERLMQDAAVHGVPIIPLHSQLEAVDQQLAFESYANGKVILSTNIAQTSITIDDIDVVVDSGLERRSEIHDGIEGLFIAEVSQADCLQRAGRAGRTKPGEYVLAPLDNMPCGSITSRPAFAIPEILRTHLDRLVLRLASVDIDIEDLQFFHAPSAEAIHHAKEILVNLGAITAAGQVTPLGLRMERFPVESRYARMLVEAEELPPLTQTKLAAIIAIQEVGGIVRGGSRNTGWLRYTDQTRSDLLAQYDLFFVRESIDPEEFEDLGIIAKSLEKAQEVHGRLCQILGLESALFPIAPDEEEELSWCIVAGHIDQIWSIGDDGLARHISGGMKRELSGGSVVVHRGLVAGMPFNLEVPTPRGLETLTLVQDLTMVRPEWLASAAPHIYSVEKGKSYFDPQWGSAATEWKVRWNGKDVRGVSSPIVERTPRARQVFAELLAAWLYERLEDDYRRAQKRSGKRLAQVPLARVQEKVISVVGGAVSINELSNGQRVALTKLASMRSYTDESRVGKGRSQGNSRRQRGKR